MFKHEFIFSSSAILNKKIILSNNSSLSKGIKKAKKT